MLRSHAVLALAAAAALFAACGNEGEGGGAAPAKAPEAAPAAATPADLSRALVLALAQFDEVEKEGKKVPVPGAARLEFLVRRGGEWQMRSLEDPDSNVFHKAMLYASPGQPDRLLTLGGMAAAVKLWSKRPGDGLVATTLWREDFGGKFSRMRDAEVADLYGDGLPAIAVATHDQGVVGIVRPDGQGGFGVEKIDHQPDTFVHEIEIGDVDGDGVLEVYATPSEPNRLDGAAQKGEVRRYVPAKGEGPVVVADLGDRHAKEILVDDLDQNGRDELYVSVEGQAEGGSLVHGIEVRRYEADTPPDQGALIGEVRDRLARFLTAGDIEGDGRKELVLATFSQGLWLMRPGGDPMKRWGLESIDRDSGGFEHAAILCDLDGDGRDELYVASDKHKEVRRYVWDGRKLVREVIYKRPDDRSIFTWNIMPIPVELVPEG
jgi:hypothetical protein